MPQKPSGNDLPDKSYTNQYPDPRPVSAALEVGRFISDLGQRLLPRRFVFEVLQLRQPGKGDVEQMTSWFAG